MIDRKTILDAIDAYSSRFPEEATGLRDLEELVKDVIDPTSRQEMRGHVTCSCVAVSPENTVLMVEHRALGRLLLPGGHVDPTDASLPGAAIREYVEETGQHASALVPLQDEFPLNPIEIDRHTIPANEARGEPSHEHWDFRFAFRVEVLPSALRANGEIEGGRTISRAELPQRLRDRLDQFVGGQE